MEIPYWVETKQLKLENCWRVLNAKKRREKEQILKTFKEIADDFKDNKIFGDRCILMQLFLFQKKGKII